MSRRSTPRKSRAAANPQHPQPPLRERREPVPSALPQRRGFWLVPALIALVTFAAFLPALQNQFVDWDDQRNFLDNPHYRGLGWTQLYWMWTTHLGHYIPLTWMTLGLDYLLWGMNPLGYHLTNLLLHAANAAVFFFVVRWLLARVLPSPSEHGYALAVSSGVAALVFAIHPLRVESVAWATERRDVLSGLFYLVAILLYLRACEGGARGRGWYWLSVAAFVGALLSKSMVVNLPVVLLILDVYPLRRLGGAVGWWSERARRVYVEKIPFVLLAASAAYVVVLLPVLGIFQSGPQIAADRYTYLASLGWAILVSAGVLFHWRRRPFLFTGLAACVLFGLGILTWNQVQVWHDSEKLWTHALATYPKSSIAENNLGGVRADQSKLAEAIEHYRQALDINPEHASAHYNLGNVLAQQGKLAEASDHYRQALRLKPDYADAHNNLGNVFAQQGKLAEAVEHYRRALKIKPDYAEALNNLGSALAQQGKLAEASDHYRQAVKIKPDYAEAHNNRGVALARQGKPAEAVEHFRRALEIKPGYAEARNNWGLALAQQGKLAEASDHYREALRLKPDYADAHANWGNVLAQQGKLAEASDHFRQALRIKPDHAAAQSSLVDALRELGTGKEDTALSRKRVQ